MIRYYKNKLKQKKPLNIFLKHLISENDKLNTYQWYIYYFYHYLKPQLNLKNISKNEFNGFKYNILKEYNTSTLFFVCHKLIIFYIWEEDLQEFCFSFVNSKYTFRIFKTDINYIVFCTSHTSDMIDDLKHFLISNNVSLSHFVLSNFLCKKHIKTHNQIITIPSGFVILNINYKAADLKLKYTLEFYTKIGNGEENRDISLIIKIIQNYIKYNTYLPPNYLSIA